MPQNANQFYPYLTGICSDAQSGLLYSHASSPWRNVEGVTGKTDGRGGSNRCHSVLSDVAAFPAVEHGIRPVSGVTGWLAAWNGCTGRINWPTKAISSAMEMSATLGELGPGVVEVVEGVVRGGNWNYILFDPRGCPLGLLAGGVGPELVLPESPVVEADVVG